VAQHRFLCGDIFLNLVSATSDLAGSFLTHNAHLADRGRAGLVRDIWSTSSLLCRLAPLIAEARHEWRGGSMIATNLEAILVRIRERLPPFHIGCRGTVMPGEFALVAK
jgi:hypothetical protein